MKLLARTERDSERAGQYLSEVDNDCKVRENKDTILTNEEDPKQIKIASAAERAPLPLPEDREDGGQCKNLIGKETQGQNMYS